MTGNNPCMTCRYGGHGEKCCKASSGAPKYTSGENCPLYAMSAQAFMQRVTNAQRRIVALEERAAQYRDMATRITSTLSSVSVRSQSPKGHVEENIAAFMDICREIEHEARRLRKYLLQANKVISRLTDAKEREVLELYYLNGYGFQDIAERLFIGERTARRIHVKALEHVQREMDLMEYEVRRPGWNPGRMQQAACVQ